MNIKVSTFLLDHLGGFIPGSNPGQHNEHMNRRAGIYAVHVRQFGGHVADLPSNYLIPLTNSVPTQAFATQCCTTGRARGLCFVVFADLVLQKESLWKNTPSIKVLKRHTIPIHLMLPLHGGGGNMTKDLSLFPAFDFITGFDD
ncbi:hypothetical protein F2Q68_00015221 [Brassica cretica]|uniref:Uncharacterized protein n=1 Tax=Brassica cretica TaxID=69181 RepID=A0A8S9HHD3_BRACR|nr:hypothetical protein F2Q68_00015221 [Brassica cretica]